MFDYVFETDNEYEIPRLKFDLQVPAIELPFEKWGYIGRSKPMPGTYHFYTDDYKFNGLWENPAKLIESKCSGVVEVNFSTNNQMPFAEGLHRIYKKRWLSRYWQMHGIPIMIDLCVSDKFVECNLLGIPKGWKSYCTRTYSHCEGTFIERDYEIACNHAGTNDILFAVYGGGKNIRDYCKSRGWLYLTENSRIRIGRGDYE